MDFTIPKVSSLPGQTDGSLLKCPLCVGLASLPLWSHQAQGGFAHYSALSTSSVPVRLHCTLQWASCLHKTLRIILCVFSGLCCLWDAPPFLVLFLPVWFLFNLFPALTPTTFLSSCWAEHLSNFREADIFVLFYCVCYHFIDPCGHFTFHFHLGSFWLSSQPPSLAPSPSSNES